MTSPPVVHPYQQQPDHAFWRQAVAEPAAVRPGLVDPVVAPAFRIDRRARIATAGSCFAQHVARHLRQAGVAPLVTEHPHPIVPAEVARRFGYGDFSARYGNVYTSRQLLQLMLRAFGEFTPQDDAWQDAYGRWFDPFRPRVHPGGFMSVNELRAERERHFDAVRRMLAELDVFVFTLGLTETWSSREEGAVYPVCPGVLAGRFDASRHELLNLGVDEVCDDMNTFVALLGQINPRAKMVLTVSPVPLVATAGDRHVMVASSYSKSVLRVAAERLSREWSGVAYFPSLELITGSFNQGRYFAPDLRSVTDEGVSHVMRLFLKHYLGIEGSGQEAADDGAVTDSPAAQAEAAFVQRLAAVTKAQCDEEALAR
jgi:GSCFA family